MNTEAGWTVIIYDCQGDEATRAFFSSAEDLQDFVEKEAKERCHLAVKVYRNKLLQPDEVFRLFPFLSEDTGAPLFESNGIVN